MKIIIAGAGDVGTALVKQFCQTDEVVVIDSDRELVENIINVYDCIGYFGSASNYRIQLEAGAKNADLLIATTDNDERNIMACMVGKNLGVKRTIARVRNPENEESIRFIKEGLGLSLAINPEKAAAHEIARLLRFPAAMKLERFSGGRLELVEYRIPKESKLDGITLADLCANEDCRVLVCAVIRDGETVIPRGDYRLKSGDVVFLTATPKMMSHFFRYLGVFRKRATSLMIAGAGRTGYYLAAHAASMDASVKIIDPDRKRCREMSELLPNAMFIVGDGSDSDLLREEGIDETDAFIAVTRSDEANILMCLSAAEQAKNCKVIAKIARPSMARFVGTKGLIDSIISSSAVTAEAIIHYVRAMKNVSGSGGIQSLHHLAGGLVEALEFTISSDADFINVPIKNLKFKNNVLLAGIVRKNGHIITPNGNDWLEADDDLIIVTTMNDIKNVSDIFQGATI